MFQAIVRGIIENKIVIDKIEQNVGQLLLLHRNVRSHASTIPHFTSGSRMEHGSKAARNTSHTAVLIPVLVVDSLHTTAAGNIIFGSRQLHGTTVWQRTGGLHQSLTESTVTDNDRTVKVLQRARKDF